MRYRGIVGDPSAPGPYGLAQHGPVVVVRIAPHPALGLSIPPVDVKMMVDTGADMTCVHSDIPKAMGLTPVRYRPIVGVSGKPEQYPVYLMGVTISMSEEPSTPLTHITFQSQIVGMPAMHKSSVQGLLGRDFLHGFQFIYDGPTGLFEIVDRRAMLPGAPVPAASAQTRQPRPPAERERSKRRR
jgi:hypothetical protein